MYKCLVVVLCCGHLFVQQAAHECPSKCACAAQLITCDFQYLTQRIQDDVELHAAYWNLSHGNITHLGHNTFHFGRRFQDSFILDLSYNQINYVSDTAFSHMKNMQQLILSGNNITDIEFKHMHADYLHSLDLSHNPHLKLPEHGFELHTLVNLQMAKCALTHIPRRFFAHMKNIETLHLEKNELTHLAAVTVAHLSLAFVDLSDNKFAIFPSVLIYHLRIHTYIKLENNPFRCNCNVHHGYTIYVRNSKNGALHCYLYENKTNSTTTLSFHNFFEGQCDLDFDNLSRSSSTTAGQASEPSQTTSDSSQGHPPFNQSQSYLLSSSHLALLVGVMAILVMIVSIVVCFRLKKNLEFREPNPLRFSILRANDDV